MRFLKWLFWLFLALAVLLFVARNWADVTVRLWGPLVADIKLPVLLLGFLLLGMALHWVLAARQRRRTRLAAVRLAPAPLAPAAADRDIDDEQDDRVPF